jgi:uncharacterized membrane-anchored protein
MLKLPQITLVFWIMKICATTLGETAGDLLSMTLGLGYAFSSMLLAGLFVLALSAQLYSTRYRPLLYWFVIVVTSTVGTTISDYMDRTLGLGYVAGSLVLGGLLVGVFALWRVTGVPFSVSQRMTRKVEMLYWLAILCSNTLGTAVGDFLADSSGLGFAGGALVISSLILLIVLAYYMTGISRVVLFWTAFVLTRPLGATMGDFLTKAHEKGGLNLGTTGTSAVLAGILFTFIVLGCRRSVRRIA